MIARMTWSGRRALGVAVAAALAGMGGCGEDATVALNVNVPLVEPMAPVQPVVIDEQALTELVHAIVDEYEAEYQVVVGPIKWAPRTCVVIQQIELSRSEHESTHGRKLYKLYPRDLESYMQIGLAEVDAPPVNIGQTVVKRTWSPVELSGDDVGAILNDKSPIPGVSLWHLVQTDDGSWWTLGEEADLFIMHRIAGDAAPGTDEGWIYAVTSRDGAVIRAAGVIESCVACHVKAGPGRLFGVKRH